MNTRAPELRALIIIFGSAGPVISTRRSSRSAGAGATVQSASRIVARGGQEVRADARVELGLALVRAAAAGRAAAGPNRRWRSATNASASGGQDPVGARDVAATELDPGRQRRPSQPSPRRTVASISPCGSVVGV